MMNCRWFSPLHSSADAVEAQRLLGNRLPDERRT
jgi:hypothetical protein